MKNLLSFVVGLIVAFTLIPTVAGAVSTQWDWTGSVLRPFQSMWNAPVVVRNVISTSTTETNIFPRALFTQASSTEFCLIGDTCITTWPTGGSGGATTTINGVTGPSFTFATGTATGIGLTISSSTGTLTFTPTVSSGYNIPLTASTTEWTNFYNTPSTRITAGTGLAWNANTLSVSSSSLGLSAGFFAQGGNSFGTTATLGTNDSQNLAFETNNTTRMTIASTTGNVGIGTTVPATKLHVVAETRYNFGNEYAIVAADTSNPNQRVSLGYDDALSAGVLQAATEGSSWDTLLLNPNGGNVGIGTTNPTTKLFIKSATGVNSILGIDTTDSGNSTSNATIRLYEASTNKWDIYNDGDAGDLFKIEPTGGTNSLTINSTGNVGIGTSSPAYRLDVDQSSGTIAATFSGSGNGKVALGTGSNGPFIQAYNEAISVTTDLTLQVAGGNVGIGTSSPRSKLDIWDGDFTTHGRLYVRENDNGNDAVVITRDADEGYVDVYSNGSVVNRIRGNGDSYITSGNVGIGTTTPGSLLTVAGTTNITGATTLGSTLNVTGQTTLANASSTNLTVSTNSYLGTVRSGTWNGSTIGEIYGGTGQATYSTGDLLYASGSNTLSKRTIGSAGDILLVSGGVPTWTATSSLGLGTTFFQQGGNSFGTTATLGTNDSQNLAFETNNSARMTITSGGNVGIGTTTPQALLSVHPSVSNIYSQQLFNIGTSSTDSGHLFSVSATSTNLEVAPSHFSNAVSRVRVVIGSFVRAFENLFVNGTMASSWRNQFCDSMLLITSYTSDANSFCGFINFDTSSSGSLVTGPIYTAIRMPSATLALSNGTTADYASLTYDYVNASWIGTSTPRMEVIAGDLNDTATTTSFHIGWTNNMNSTSMPGIGCWVTASSTTANWVSLCSTGSATSTVDTGVSTTTLITKWRLELNSSTFSVRYKTNPNSSYTSVADITTNIPSTSTTLNAGIKVHRSAGGASIGPDMGIWGIRYWVFSPWNAYPDDDV